LGVSEHFLFLPRVLTVAKECEEFFGRKIIALSAYHVNFKCVRVFSFFYHISSPKHISWTQKAQALILVILNFIRFPFAVTLIGFGQSLGHIVNILFAQTQFFLLFFFFFIFIQVIVPRFIDTGN
jgi:hypothetical protein